MKLSERFVRVYVDCTKRGTFKDMKKEYGIRGYPTIVFADPKGEFIDEVVGSQPTNAVLKKMKSVLSDYPEKKSETPTKAAQDQDEIVKKILKRINREIEASNERLRSDLAKLVRDELKSAGLAKASQPKKKTFQQQLNELASKIIDDKGVNSGLKKLFKTKQGADFVKQAMEQQGTESLIEAWETYFDKDDKGRFVLKEEFEADAEQLLEMLAEGEKKPDDQPKKSDKKPYIGFSPADFTDDERTELGLAAGIGIKVFEVAEGSPAEKAGIKPGDVIYKFGKEKLSEENIEKLLYAHAPGDTVRLRVLRDGKKITVKLPLGTRDDE